MKFNVLIGTSALAMIAATPAFAQDNTADENVIIVTATLRAANVQDIPIAVTAVSPNELERQNVQDIRTLSSITPSFSLQTSQSDSQGTSIRLRGVGTTGNNSGLESSVGVFIDGVYQSRPGVALGDLIDLERLEVLRGPQGTLFGRNTSAGALNITTKRPNLSKVEGFVNASYGNYDYYGIQAGVSAPLVENTLGVRFAGAYRKRDGTLKSVNSDAESATRDRYILRGQLLWEPSADISLRIIGDYARTDEECCSAVILRETEVASMPGGFYGVPNNAGVSTSGPDALRNMRSNDLEGFTTRTKQWGGSAELKWGLGENAQLTYIGSYRKFKGKGSQDDFVAAAVYNVGPSPTIPTLDYTRGLNRLTSHELRLQGSAFEDKLDWLVGAYYSDEKIDETQTMSLGADYQAYASSALFPVVGNLLSTFGPNPLLALTTIASGAPVPAGGSYGINRYRQDSKNWSVFTHNTLQITDEISVTLGARYVKEKKEGSFNQIDAYSPACEAIVDGRANIIGALSGTIGAARATNLADKAAAATCFPFATSVEIDGQTTPIEYDRVFRDDELTYTGQLAYNNNAGFMAYAGFSHGFKSGGFNLDPAAATLASGEEPRFKSEKVDAYEVGIKTTLLDNKLIANLAVFHMDMSDFQVLEFTGVQFQTFNVPKAKSSGAELELLGRFHPHMTINASVSYTDARYPKDCGDGLDPSLSIIATVNTLCGAQLTNAPKWAAVLGVGYDGPLNSSGWGLIGNVNMNYSGKRRTSTTPTETEPAPHLGGDPTLYPLPYDWQENYFKINARIGFKTPDERFTFELWGTNLSNEITRGITANTPLRGGNALRSRVAFPEEPRTYGVTVRSKF